MSWLMVALIGPGRGPLVPTAQKKSVLRVSGYTGGRVRAYVDNELSVTGEANGNYDLPNGEFVSVDYDGDSKCFIAEVVRET